MESESSSSRTTFKLPDQKTSELLKRIYPCNNANNPHMANAQKRKETFDSRWTGGNLIASTSQIAKAGFFFLGKENYVNLNHIIKLMYK